MTGWDLHAKAMLGSDATPQASPVPGPVMAAIYGVNADGICSRWGGGGTGCELDEAEFQVSHNSLIY